MINLKKSGRQLMATVAVAPKGAQFVVFGTTVTFKHRRLRIDQVDNIHRWDAENHKQFQRYFA